MVKNVAYCLTGRAAGGGILVGRYMIDYEKKKKYPADVIKIIRNHLQKHVIKPNSDINIDIYIYNNDITLKDDIVNLLKPKDYIIEKQNLRDCYPYENLPMPTQGGRVQCMHHFINVYQIKKVLELVEKSNIKYDFIYEGRLDTVWLTDFKFSDYDNQFIYTGKYPNYPQKFNDDIRTIDENYKKKHKNRSGYLNLTGWFAFGNYDLMLEFKNFHKYKGTHNRDDNNACTLVYNYFKKRNKESLIKLTKYLGRDYDFVKKLYCKQECIDDREAAHQKDWKRWIESKLCYSEKYLKNTYFDIN
tara:strand:- start:2689 stop:3594 length:906 start_codon:yes stop_codon:yes gene_type:complete